MVVCISAWLVDLLLVIYHNILCPVTLQSLQQLKLCNNHVVYHKYLVVCRDLQFALKHTWRNVTCVQYSTLRYRYRVEGYRQTQVLSLRSKCLQTTKQKKVNACMGLLCCGSPHEEFMLL